MAIFFKIQKNIKNSYRGLLFFIFCVNIIVYITCKEIIMIFKKGELFSGPGGLSYA